MQDWQEEELVHVAHRIGHSWQFLSVAFYKILSKYLIGQLQNGRMRAEVGLVLSPTHSEQLVEFMQF